MSTFLGGSEVSGMYLGGNEISEMYLGSNLIYTSSDWPYRTLRISKDGGVTWEDYGRPTSVGREQFYNKGITHVELPDSLTTISYRAFMGNQLTSVVIPDSVTSIEISAFRNNQLTSVVIPDSVTSIENSVFRDNQLTSVVIPNSVTSIESWAFDINPLEEVSIGPNTTYETVVSPSFPSSAVITVRDESDLEEQTPGFEHIPHFVSINPSDYDHV